MTIPAHTVLPSPTPAPLHGELAGLFRDAPVPMALVDVRSRRVVRANAALERLLGHGARSLEGRALRELDAGDPEEAEAHLLLALACGDDRTQPRTWMAASGERIPVDVAGTRLEGAHGTLLALYVRDRRDMAPAPIRRRGEEPPGPPPPAVPSVEDPAVRAWMAQKHESLGRLATGFAEELEGILGRVLRSAEGLQAAGMSSAATHAGLGEILGAAREARSLVRELLAYAGRQPVEVSTFGLNEVVAGTEDALRDALPSDIGLLVRPCSAPALVSADPARVREILVHLVDHARESMPDGGYLVVATEEVELDESFAREHPSTHAGPHVMLSVSDTGRGLDDEARARIFEPFYSSRVRGTGGGMGLATVYGMVKQLGGSIWATSRPGVGTTFRMYLPKAESRLVAEDGGRGA